MKTYKTSVLVSMMLGIFSTTAFSATVPAGTTLSETQIFRQNTHSDPGSLDPQLVQENTAAQIAIDLFEGLIWLDENGQVQPAQRNGQSLTMVRFILFHYVMQNGQMVHR
ncbi:hypothetical protein [uncultured Haemophilus sp.]|uniref:hypothetical protein n=1 Tax=uncultured Haemophilus sp. TaxID=237779 RepID=UPI0025E20925|nr:hypothetical protein [uncultured Haemophilus sp.]